MLLAIGLPLIAFKSELPAWLESGAEKAVGVVILVLAARVLWKWVRGDYRAGRPPPRRARRATRECTATSAAARSAGHATRRSARRSRPSGSGSFTAWPAPAPSCCC